jgi:predicted transposase YbfD/YdcC
VVSAWLVARAARTSPPTPELARILPQVPPRAIAVDGKSARGARQDDGRAVHLLAAFDTGSGIVLGQSVVDGKTNELFVVKGNRPKLYQQLAGLPWRDIPAVDVTHDAAHARRETRTLKLTAVTNAVTGGILFPHAELAIQIVRRRRPARSRGWHSETVYAVTDLSWHQIRADQLAEAIRQHWHVENRLHWVRDVTFAEDLSQIRTGHGPANMATLRNFALSRHRLAGATNIAAACRRTSRHPNRVLPLLT